MANLGVFDPDLYAGGDPWKSGLPLELFAELRDATPCYWQPLQDEPMFIDGAWVVTRYDDIVTIIRDTARFSTRRGTSVRRFDPTVAECGGKPTMMSMDGAQHRKNRMVTNQLFSRRAINAFEDQFRSIATRLIGRALEMGEIDFVKDVARYMPLDAVSDILGVPPEDREQVLAWTNTITVPLDTHFTPSPRDFQEALDGLWRYGLDLSERSALKPEECVMAAIAKGRADGRLTDDEVSGYMLQLAAAGNETTRNAIAFGLHALLLRPEQMGVLRGFGGVVPESAVEEILRWSAPTIHTVRLALEEVELHGETIRAGEPVALMLGSGNFDPAQFERPETFDVSRSPNDHIAFGTAEHICLGIHVARLEIKVMFEELLRMCSSIELDGDAKFVRDNLIHGVRAMPLKVSRG